MTLRVLVGSVGILMASALVLTHAPRPGPVPVFPHLARHPAPWHAPTTRLATLPRHTDDAKPFQVDLRAADLAALDLSNAVADLDWAAFDMRTVWPERKRLPADFDPARVMDLGKDPGLGVRSLHARGVTGRGVALAVIDQPLLVTHREFADRLRLYEDVGYSPLARRMGDYQHATMHGCATASIAVGRTVGVAPEAQLYYISTTALDVPYVTRRAITLSHYADALRRVLEINGALASGERIRVVSLSIGWVGAGGHGDATRGYEEIEAAANDAKAQGIFVTSSNLQQTHNLAFHGLGRSPMADPNDFGACRPGLFWAEAFQPGDPWYAGRLLVPMDHRTVAAPGGDDDYAHYGSGGWSWCTPYLAGVYALACQVDPAMTPQRFCDLAATTARDVSFDRNGQRVSLGKVLDPPAFIDACERAAGRSEVRR